MPDTNFTIRLDITGRDTGATAIMQRVGQDANRLSGQLGQVGQRAQQSARQVEHSFSQIRFPNLGSMLGVIGAGFAVTHAVQQFTEGQREARLLASTIKGIGESADGTGAVVDQMGERFLRMGISARTETQRLARQLIALGATAQTLPDLLEKAVRVGAAKGQDPAELIKRLTFALNDKTPQERLKALNDSLSNLSQNAPALADIGDEFSRLKVQVRETTETIGGFILGLGAPLMKDFAGLVTGIRSALDALEQSKAGSVLVALGGAGAKVVIELLLLMKAVQVVQSAFGFMSGAGEKLRMSLMGKTAATNADTVAGSRHVATTEMETVTTTQLTVAVEALSLALFQLANAKNAVAMSGGMSIGSIGSIGSLGKPPVGGLVDRFGRPMVNTASTVAPVVTQTATATVAPIGAGAAIKGAGVMGGTMLVGGSILAGNAGGEMGERASQSIFGEGEGARKTGGYFGATGGGAVAGALIGSIVPVIGTAIGAGLGAAIGSLTYVVKEGFTVFGQLSKSNKRLEESFKGVADRTQDFAGLRLKPREEIVNDRGEQQMSPAELGRYVEALRLKQANAVASAQLAGVETKEGLAHLEVSRQTGLEIAMIQRLVAEKKVAIERSAEMANRAKTEIERVKELVQQLTNLQALQKGQAAAVDVEQASKEKLMRERHAVTEDAIRRGLETGTMTPEMAAHKRRAMLNEQMEFQRSELRRKMGEAEEQHKTALEGAAAEPKRLAQEFEQAETRRLAAEKEQGRVLKETDEQGVALRAEQNRLEKEKAKYAPAYFMEIRAIDEKLAVNKQQQDENRARRAMAQKELTESRAKAAEAKAAIDKFIADPNNQKQAVEMLNQQRMLLALREAFANDMERLAVEEQRRLAAIDEQKTKDAEKNADKRHEIQNDEMRMTELFLSAGATKKPEPPKPDAPKKPNVGVGVVVDTPEERERARLQNQVIEEHRRQAMADKEQRDKQHRDEINRILLEHGIFEPIETPFQAIPDNGQQGGRGATLQVSNMNVRVEALSSLEDALNEVASLYQGVVAPAFSQSTEVTT
jgi:hypothetical protein